jgi:hypothetical protein
MNLISSGTNKVPALSTFFSLLLPSLHIAPQSGGELEGLLCSRCSTPERCPFHQIAPELGWRSAQLWAAVAMVGQSDLHFFIFSPFEVIGGWLASLPPQLTGRSKRG